MTKLTNAGLVECVKKQINHPYWYGCFGQIATQTLYAAKKKQYPSYYKASDFTKQFGQRVFDCMGLVKYYIWSGGSGAPSYVAKQDLGCTGMYNASKKKGKIEDFDKIPGRLVYKGTNSKKTHVGVYVGNDTVIEAKGHSYGVIESKLSSGSWKYWAQCPFIEESAAADDPTPAPVPVKPAEPNIYIVKKGDTMTAIAKKLKLSLYNLKKKNPQIKNINLIYPGQKIYY